MITTNKTTNDNITVINFTDYEHANCFDKKGEIADYIFTKLFDDTQYYIQIIFFWTYHFPSCSRRIASYKKIWKNEHHPDFLNLFEEKNPEIEIESSSTELTYALNISQKMDRNIFGKICSALDEKYNLFLATITNQPRLLSTSELFDIYSLVTFAHSNFISEPKIKNLMELFPNAFLLRTFGFFDDIEVGFDLYADNNFFDSNCREK